MKPLTKTSRHCSERCGTGKGFTLLEILCALTVFLLLLGGMLVMAQSILELQSESEEARYEQSREQALYDLLRNNFLNLPADSEFELIEGGKVGVKSTQLILRGAPLAFSFGQVAGEEQEVILEVSGDKTNKQLLLRRGPEDSSSNSSSSRDQSISLPLLWQAEEISIDFFDPESSQWKASWEPEMGRPSLIRLSVLLPEADPRQMHFKIAPLVSVESLAQKNKPQGQEGQDPELSQFEDEPPPNANEENGNNGDNDPSMMDENFPGNPEDFAPPPTMNGGEVLGEGDF